ncbi:MAG: hypothetical protein AAF512_16560, partial [Pseudomonadota bacterium]
VLDNSRINADAFEGNGGNIVIETQGILKFDATPVEQVITASSERGISGDIAIASPEVDITNSLETPAPVFISSQDLQDTPCAQRGVENISRFIDAQYPGTPPLPQDIQHVESGMMSVPITAEDMLSVPLSERCQSLSDNATQ